MGVDQQVYVRQNHLLSRRYLASSLFNFQFIRQLIQLVKVDAFLKAKGMRPSFHHWRLTRLLFKIRGSFPQRQLNNILERQT